MEERISLKTKLWLTGADTMVATLSGLITGGGLTYYFTKWMGLEPGKAAIVWMIFGIWNAINDPIFGYISDKTKSSLGRRLPYIRYGSPIYALIFILCWTSFPFAGNQWAMFFQMLISLFLFDTLYTAIATALYVMPYEITLDNKARGSIFLWKVIFSIFSLAVPLILMPLIQPEPGQNVTGFQLIMTAIGIFAGLIVFFSTFFYSEKNYIKEEQQPQFLKSIGYCFKNKAFIIFEIISFTIIYVQTALMQGVLYYFAEFHISMVNCYVALIGGAILGMFLFTRSHEKIGVGLCVSIMCGFFSLGCLSMAFLGSLPVVSVFGFLAIGFGFAGGMYVIPLMNGDVIDFDETRTGLRREGMYAGVNSFITKPAISIAQSVFLMIIEAFGYIQNAVQGSQTAAAKHGILIGWMLVPGILLMICFFSMFLYPLKGDEWKAKKSVLRLTHQKKQEQYNNLNSSTVHTLDSIR